MLAQVCRPRTFKNAFNLKNICLATLTTSAMSNITRTPQQVVYANETPEGVGAIVRRSIGSPHLRNLTPFLMLDHGTIAPEGDPEKPSVGFPDHPHRGQSTVTYVIDGMMQHEDFTGTSGKLEKGDVQWMTAGKGIVHSEMPLFDPDPAKRVPAVVMQLWLDLPADKKMIEPSYQEKKAKDIDHVSPTEGVDITVISGESHGVKGFVRPVGGCWFMDFTLSKPGATVFQPLPKGWTAFAYVLSGKLQIGEDSMPIDKFNTVVLSAEPDQDGVQLSRPEGTDENTRFVLIAGEPLTENTTVQHGPFVVNSRQEVIEAMMDYQLGRNGFERAPGWKSEIGSKMYQ